MHLNINNLSYPLSKEQLLHLQMCEECTELSTIVQSLQNDAQKIKPIQPSTDVLGRILNANIKQPKRNNWLLKLSVACSFLVLTCTGYLMVSNYQLQNQVDQLLVLNRMQEMEIQHTSTSSYQQTMLLQQISINEEKLKEKTSPKNKVKLLQQRANLMKLLIQLQNGGQGDVYEI